MDSKPPKVVFSSIHAIRCSSSTLVGKLATARGASMGRSSPESSLNCPRAAHLAALDDGSADELLAPSAQPEELSTASAFEDSCNMLHAFGETA